MKGWAARSHTRTPSLSFDQAILDAHGVYRQPSELEQLIKASCMGPDAKIRGTETHLLDYVASGKLVIPFPKAELARLLLPMLAAGVDIMTYNFDGLKLTLVTVCGKEIVCTVRPGKGKQLLLVCDRVTGLDFFLKKLGLKHRGQHVILAPKRGNKFSLNGKPSDFVVRILLAPWFFHRLAIGGAWLPHELKGLSAALKDMAAMGMLSTFCRDWKRVVAYLNKTGLQVIKEGSSSAPITLNTCKWENLRVAFFKIFASIKGHMPVELVAFNKLNGDVETLTVEASHSQFKSTLFSTKNLPTMVTEWLAKCGMKTTSQALWLRLNTANTIRFVLLKTKRMAMKESDVAAVFAEAKNAAKKAKKA